MDAHGVVSEIVAYQLIRFRTFHCSLGTTTLSDSSFEIKYPPQCTVTKTKYLRSVTRTGLKASAKEMIGSNFPISTLQSEVECYVLYASGTADILEEQVDGL